METINVLSLFDGLGGARIALDRLGIPCKYYASEIDKYAISVHQKNYPDTVQIGDVTKVFAKDLPKIDLLIGGSPCQDLSISKENRQGLEGEKSKLFFEFVRLKNELNPRYFLLENVASMSKENRNRMTRIMGVQPILINSALLTAQHRERWYWTNIPHHFTMPKDRGIALKDILESGEGCLYNNYKKTHKVGLLKSSTLVARYGRGFTNFDSQTAVTSKPNVLNQYQDGVQTSLQNRVMDVEGKSLALSNFVPKVPLQTSFINKNRQGERIYSTKGKTVSLTANGGGVGAGVGLYEIGDEVRKLTPLECERLQGLPDNYTASVSNSQRYKMIGNGFTVPVIEHLLQFMQL